MIKTPGSVQAQQGSGGQGMKTGYSRGGGKNQGRVSGTSRRYVAHPRKQGQ